MTTFSTAPRGYDREEVDAHLARLPARLDQALTEMVALRTERDALRTQLQRAGPAQVDAARQQPLISRHVRTTPSASVDPAAVHPPLRPHPDPKRSAGRARRRHAAGPVATVLVWLVALVVAGFLLL
ncbi:MAG: hypothetical protein JWN08_364 [Frankiales bacterium]|nr:hypothetical protein [Frankiales bacterium]